MKPPCSRSSGAFASQITFLSVHDLAATADFYERLLGLTLWLDQGDCRIYQAGRDAYIGLCQRETPVQRAGVILCFVTPAVDEWHEWLMAARVVCEKAPQSNPAYGIYHAFYRDPDGYLIEIQRFESQ